MAADFTALFGHTLNWEQIEALPIVLNERWSGETTTLLRRPGLSQPGWNYRPEDHLYRSLREEFEDAGNLLLKGPDGFDGQLFTRVFELYNWTRWWTFVTDPAVRNALRETCRLLAGVLGARTVIYLPDSHYDVSRARDLPYDGVDLDAIAAWLAQNAGQPAASIETIAAAQSGASREVNGYYVDTF